MSSQLLFISYSHEDQSSVIQIKKALLRVGISIWLDHENLLPGTIDWGDAIEIGIKASHAILYVASPDSKKSRFVVHEADLAFHYHKPIIPFWIRGDEWIDVAPFGMARIQYIDARSELPSSLKVLLDYLTQKLNFTLTPLPPPPVSIIVSPPPTTNGQATPQISHHTMSGRWSAKRQLSSWSMRIEEKEGKLVGRGVQITIMGDMLEYDLIGRLDGANAQIELAYNRNPLIKAKLILHLNVHSLSGAITENDGVAHPIEFTRLIIEQK